MEGPGRDGGRAAPPERGPAAAVPVGFLGPEGTFTEEALLALFGDEGSEPVAFPSIAEVLRAAEEGAVAAGVVPIENSIEGTVAATIDHLVFDTDLLIQAEVVLDVHLYLLGPPGLALEEVRSVVSFPHATAQCRRFLREQLGEPAVVAANSTAEAARLLAEQRPAGSAAIATRLAAQLYGLETLAEEVEDYAGNQTRFLAVAPGRIPPPTGHDKTSVACFQRQDHPGSLHEILGQFSARSLNLTKIESRPTKRSLGEYCFTIDLEGHVSDEVVGDCLAELHATVGDCKFLGSYPAAGPQGASRREQVSARRSSARRWLAGLRRLVDESSLA